MSLTLPNGAQVFICSGYGTPGTVTAATNANPTVVTLSASHGIIAGDIFEWTSGWSRVDQKLMKAASVSTNDITLVGLDTSSTTIYTPGGGTGTFREISGWTQIQQVLTSTSSGGAQQFLTYQLLEADSQRNIPTVKNPFQVQFTIADDPTLAGFILAGAANDDRLKRAVKVTLPSGTSLYYNAYISLNRIPSLTVNQLMEVTLDLSLLAEPTRF